MIRDVLRTGFFVCSLKAFCVTPCRSYELIYTYTMQSTLYIALEPLYIRVHAVVQYIVYTRS